MKIFLAFATIFYCFAVVVLSRDNECCDQTFLAELKENIGGKWPVKWFNKWEMMWNRRYALVLVSKHLLDAHNLTCVETDFGFFGNKDKLRFRNGDLEVVPFSYDFKDGVGYWSDWRFKAVVYSWNHYFCSFGDCCFGVYECSDDGCVAPVWKVYCEADLYCKDEDGCCKAEVGEIKEIFCKAGADPAELVDSCVDYCEDEWEEWLNLKL